MYDQQQPHYLTFKQISFNQESTHALRFRFNTAIWYIIGGAGKHSFTKTKLLHYYNNILYVVLLRELFFLYNGSSCGSILRGSYISSCFYCTVLCSETRIFFTSTEHQPHNSTTHNNKYMDQPWDYLVSSWSFLLLSLMLLGLILQ